MLGCALHLSHPAIHAKQQARGDGWIDSTSLLQLDFANNRAALSGQETSLSDLLVCARPSTAWARDKAGKILQFAPNQPRLTDKGLLVWDAVEQLVDPDLTLASQALPNTVTNVDGFYRIEKTASGPYKYSKLSFTGVAERVRAELTLKGGSGDGVTLGIYDFNASAFANGQMTILSGPGSMSVTGAGRWLVTGLSNSAETKIEIITSAPLVQGNSCALLFYPGAHNSATVGKVFYVKEAMVHVGTNPVPPMPQKGVVAADNISVDLSGLDLSSGFYGVMDIEQIWQDSASGSEKMLQIGLDTANRFDLVRKGDGSVQARFVNNGATIGTTSYSAPRDGSSQKIAFGAGPDYLGHATDNEDYAEDLTMSYRDDLADLMISHSYSGSRNDCLLKSLTLYSGTPTTAKLQELVQ